MNQADAPYVFTMHGLLDTRLVTGRCSSGLVAELDHLLVNRITNIFMITDEIAALEGASGAKPTRTKPAAEFKGKRLRGLWHKHHLHSSLNSMAQNIVNQSRRNPKAFMVPMGLSPSQLWKVAGRISSSIVLDGYKDRSDASELTGEWIVFAKQDGINYYLTLGSHNESDEAVWGRCKACASDFPELRILAEERC